MGFEIGWDYAAYQVRLPAECTENEVHLGYDEGRRRFPGRRPACEKADRYVRKWLQIRLNAWRRSRIFDAAITPDYLRTIDVSHCPVTREPLTHGTGKDTDWSIDRIQNNSGYAPGNLVVLSVRANNAKGDLSTDEIFRAASMGMPFGNLEPVQWIRVAALVALMDREQFGPLLMLPPPRILIGHPLTTVQFVTSRIVGGGGVFRGEQMIREICKGKAAKKQFDRYMATLAGASRRAMSALPAGPRRIPWSIEDGWQSPEVMREFVIWVASIGDSQIPSMYAACRKAFDGTVRKSPGRASWGEETEGYLVTDAY